MHTRPLRKIPVQGSLLKEEVHLNQATISTPRIVDEDQKILHS